MARKSRLFKDGLWSDTDSKIELHFLDEEKEFQWQR